MSNSANRESKDLPTKKGDCLAVYGTLLRDEGVQQRLGTITGLRALGTCVIPGRLYNLGEYPGLKPGEGRVHGELYEILDPAVLAVLDAYEGCDPNSPEGSLYSRRLIRLLEPAYEAWIYIFNGDVSQVPEIPEFGWAEYRRRLGSGA